MTLLVALLILIGLPLVVAPGALLTALQMPEFYTGRRPRYSRAPRRWTVTA